MERAMNGPARRRATGSGVEEGGPSLKKAVVLAVALAFVSVGGVLAAGLTAVWLTDEVRVFGLVALPAAFVAGLLVLYFDWRRRLVSDARAGLRDHAGGVQQDEVDADWKEAA
jgi:hypothetical protein